MYKYVLHMNMIAIEPNVIVGGWVKVGSIYFYTKNNEAFLFVYL